MDALSYSIAPVSITPVSTASVSIVPMVAAVRRLCLRLLAGLACGLLALGAAAEELPSDCGDLTNRYGPYDYTNPEHFQKRLPIVEKWHFTKEQELATYQADSKRRVDLDYTLRAFPNHHRALMALTRTIRMHPNKEWEIRPECYYLRAVAWRPQDGVTRMIYGLYLHQQHRLGEAEQQYKLAVNFQRDYAEAHYNLGLLYADQKRWPEALESAHKAYALNYPLPGLRNRLLAAAAWRDAPVAPPAAAPSAETPATTTPTGAAPTNSAPVTDAPVTAIPASEAAPAAAPATKPASTEPPPTPVPGNTAPTRASPVSETPPADTSPTLSHAEDRQ